MFQDWERALLDECRVAGLATIAADGTPALVPVCYALVGDTLVIAIDEKPKAGRRLARLHNIERDPRVSLLADRYGEDWTQLAWVRIEGSAEVLERGGAVPATLAALRDRYLQYRDMDLEPRPLIRITPTRVVSWRWTRQG